MPLGYQAWIIGDMWEGPLTPAPLSRKRRSWVYAAAHPRWSVPACEGLITTIIADGRLVFSSGHGKILAWVFDDEH